MGLYSTCRVITGYDAEGNNVLCGAKTLDGSAYCREHDGADGDLEPWDSEEFPDDDFKVVNEEVK